MGWVDKVINGTHKTPFSRIKTRYIDATGTGIRARGYKKGDKKEITFTQKMSLQGGEYLLSFGVTGFEQNDFTVYHRLYDVLNITVVSDKNTVGYYDMNTTCKVRDIDAGTD